MTSSVEPNPTTTVVVYNGWGRIEVHPLSVETARAWLVEKLAELPEGCVPSMKFVAARQADPSGQTGPHVVVLSFVSKLFSSILSAALGEGSNSLYKAWVVDPADRTATMPVTKEIRDELVLWAFGSKVSLEAATAEELNAAHPEKHLSFMAGLLARSTGREVVYLRNDDYAEVGELQQLLYGKWAPSGDPGRIVSRYLEVLNQYGHRDERYQLGEFHGTAPLVEGAPVSAIAGSAASKGIA